VPLLAVSSRIAMQLQTFIASALLLSGLASAVNLPRANEAAECTKVGSRCNVLKGPLCCADSVCVSLTLPRPRQGEDGVSATIHAVFLLLLTQLWRIVVPSHLIAPARKLSLMNQGQIKFATIITCSYFISRTWLSFAFA
jgi:hypothetical protein